MLGRLIKDYLDEKGLKQTRIAELAGMTTQTLNDILHERRKVEATEYFRLCKAMGISITYFYQKMGYEAQDQETA